MSLGIGTAAAWGELAPSSQPSHTRWLRLHPLCTAWNPTLGAHCRQQPASVESESNHLMLNLISLISPCLQLLYPELKVHASCLFWAPWVIRKSFGTARVGPSWCSAVLLCLEQKGVFSCALHPAGITPFKYSSVSGLSATYAVENHSGKLEVHSDFLNYSSKQY